MRAAPRDGLGQPGREPLVGRAVELARVVDLLRSDRPIAILGEAGIGKTTLVRAAVTAAGRDLHEGGGFATLAWMPHLAIRRATGLPVMGDPGLVATRVERIVGPDILLIDDLQWTDPATRTVVGLLVDRVSIVVTVREGDAGAAAALQPLLARRVEMVRLQGLDDEAALDLVRLLHPDASPARLRRIIDRAGGNPLLLSELAARGESSSSLARAILGQVESLSRVDRQALELVALADRPLPAEVLGPAGSRLEQRGLVQREVDGLAVRHRLIAEAIVDQVDATRRRDLHARLADLLPDPAERAHHLVAAGRHAQALDAAVAVLDATTDPRTRAALLVVAAEASGTEGSVWRVRAAQQLRAIGSPVEAIALLEAPIEGDDDLRALGASILAGALDHEGRNDEALAVIEGSRYLHPRPGSEGDLELAIVESVVLVNRGHLGEALDVAERVSASAPDAAHQPRFSGHLAALRLYLGRTEQLGELAQAVATALASGDGGTAAGRAMDLYYLTLAIEGAAPAAIVASDAAGRLEQLGFHTRAAELRAESAQASIFAGDLRATVLHVDAMLEEPLGLLSRQRLGYNRGLALGLLGRFEESERTFTAFEVDATDTFDGRGALLWCWAEAALWSGQPDRAYDLAVASLGYTAFNDAEFVLPSLTRAWSEGELGREPTPLGVDAPFRALAGAEPEIRGLRAQARGDDLVAIASFEEAAALWAGFHHPRELLCCWAAGESMRRAGDHRAVAALETALASASAIGFEPLAARIRRSLRLAGVRISAPRARSSHIELTAREAEVAGLVEQGLSNREIARRLGLGRPTVVRLVASAMGKLGVARRTQLAAREPA